MTEADYDARIAQNRQAMDACRRQIRELEENINELRALKDNMGSLQVKLHDTAGRAENILGALPQMTGALVGAGLGGGLFSRLLGTVRGEDYATADSGLGASMEIIREKINEYQNQIEQKQSAIYDCARQVSLLEDDKAQYLAAAAADEGGI